MENYGDMNPISLIQCRLRNNIALLASKLSECIKLAKIAIVWVMGNVEDEYTLSTVNDMKLKLRNRLNEHMDCEDVWTIIILVGYVSLQ